MNSQKNLRTWLVAKSNPHDTSGVENPENWLWERIDGVFYPAEKIEVKEESEEEKAMYDALDPDMTDEEIEALGYVIKYKTPMPDEQVTEDVNWRENCGHAVVV